MADSPKRWLRYAGMGVEFAASFGAFILVGWWVGRHFECNPWAMLIGAGLGFVGAMYNLIREGLKLQREAASQDMKSRIGHSDGSDELR
jgi:F0F1-type ATP synthase assembly protein I